MKKIRGKSKAKVQSKLIVLIVSIVFVLGVGLWALYPRSGYSDKNSAGCKDIHIPNYPPAPISLPRYEIEAWANAEDTSLEAYDRFTQIVDQMTRSSLPILSNAGTFLWNTDLQLGFYSIEDSKQEVDKVIHLDQLDGIPFLQINASAFSGENSYDYTHLAIGIAHEALHIQEVMATTSLTETMKMVVEDSGFRLCGGGRSDHLFNFINYLMIITPPEDCNGLKRIYLPFKNTRIKSCPIISSTGISLILPYCIFNPSPSSITYLSSSRTCLSSLLK